MALTNKQQVFISEYLKCWNATEAARIAKYAHPNVEGPKNLVKPSISNEIERRLRELAMPADEVVYRLGKQAKSSIGNFLSISDDGYFRIDLSHPEADLSLIKKIRHTQTIRRVKNGKDDEEVETNQYDLELYDSQSALVHLGKHHGIFAKDRKMEVTWRNAVPSDVDPGDMVDQFKQLIQKKAQEAEAVTSGD